jgi:hypothetical protein
MARVTFVTGSAYQVGSLQHWGLCMGINWLRRHRVQHTIDEVCNDDFDE